MLAEYGVLTGKRNPRFDAVDHSFEGSAATRGITRT